MNPLPMVVADLRSMRWTGMAVVLIVAVAVASVVAIDAQERTVRTASSRAADDFDLVIGAPGSEAQLVFSSVYLDLAALALVDGQVLNTLARDPRVAAVAPIAFGDRIGGAPVIGTTAAFASRWGRLGPAEGRLFDRLTEAVVGADVALAVGSRAVPVHGIAGHGQEDEEEHARHGAAEAYTVVGRLPRLGSAWDRSILVPVESVWAVHGLGHGHREDAERRPAWLGPPFDGTTVPGVPAIVVKPRAVADAYALRAQYRGNGTTAVFPAEVLVGLYRVMGDVRDALLVATWANTALVFSALALVVATLTGLRRRRYAILRALGAPARYIAAVVWLGSAALVATGGVIGLPLGWLGAAVLSIAVEARTGLALAPAPAWSDVALAFGLVCLGTLASVVPALLAHRVPVGIALRS